MKVSEIMKTTVYSVRSNDPLSKVASLICRTKVSGISVIDEGKIVGIVTERDLLKAMYPSFEEFWEDPTGHMDFEYMEQRYEDVSKKKVKDHMSTPVITIPPDTPIMKAASLLIRKHLRRLPIVKDGEVVGIISQGDIHQAIFAKECALHPE
jgi:CBS domain-containing protein